MKNISIYIFLSGIFLLQSCCSNENSLSKPGYPFNGTFQEIVPVTYNHVILSNPALFSLEDSNSLDGKIISDAFTCNNYFRQVDSNYNTDINFDKFSLTLVDVSLIYTEDPDLQVKFFVNHTTKSCLLELRGKRRFCVALLSSHVLRIHKYVLIPKIPAEYSYSVRKFYPAE